MLTFTSPYKVTLSNGICIRNVYEKVYEICTKYARNMHEKINEGMN